MNLNHAISIEKLSVYDWTDNISSIKQLKPRFEKDCKRPSSYLVSNPEKELERQIRQTDRQIEVNICSCNLSHTYAYTHGVLESLTFARSSFCP